MKSIKTLGLAAVAALAAGQVQAATATLDLTMSTGDVCVLGTPSTTTPDIASVIDDLKPTGASVDVTFGDSYCNAAHEIELTSLNAGMTIAAANAPLGDSDSFADVIDYTAAIVNWADAITSQSSLDTEGAAAPLSIGGGTGVAVSGPYRANPAETNTLTISITPKTIDGNPLVSGTYDDDLTLTIAINI